MGVIDTPARGAPPVVPPGPEQDLLLRAATEEIQDRGFIVSSAGQPRPALGVLKQILKAARR